MEHDPQLLRTRLKAFVRRTDAKTLARAVGCDVRTAENIREGHWPNARHWLGLLAAFGEDITEAVFHPDKAATRLEVEVRELEEALEARRAALRDVARAHVRRPQAVAAVEDRAALMAGSRPAEPHSFNPK